MTQTAKALRETSDALRIDLEALQSVEDHKRSVQPEDPAMVEISEQIETLARRVLGRSEKQRRIVEHVQDLVQAGSSEAPDRPIDEMPRPIHTILAEWRAADVRASELAPGSVEATALAEEIDRLRAEYGEAYESARGRPPGE